MTTTTEPADFFDWVQKALDEREAFWSRWIDSPMTEAEARAMKKEVYALFDAVQARRLPFDLLDGLGRLVMEPAP